MRNVIRSATTPAARPSGSPLRLVARSAAALALVSGALVAAIGVGTARAATVPPWEPDPASVGTLSFYNAAGQQVTGGTITDAPFATYVRGSAPGRAGDTLATLFGYLPKNGVPLGAWSGGGLSASTPYPRASAPAPLNGSLPLVTFSAADGPVLKFFKDEFPNTATDAYQGLYQLRLITSGTGGQNPDYQSADIQITGDSWTQIYPDPGAVPPTTSTTAPATTLVPTTTEPATTTTTAEPATTTTTPGGTTTTTTGSTTSTVPGSTTTTGSPSGPDSTSGDGSSSDDASGSILPVTGSASGRIVLAGAALIVAGALGLAASRRRRTTAPDGPSA